MAVNYVLRCKTSTGQHMIKSLNGDSTVDELRAMLLSLTAIEPERMKILTGYPPQKLDLTDGNRLLSTLIAGPSESLILEEIKDLNAERETAVRINELLANELNEQQKGFGGMLMRHPVPANNSCLFTSVYFCMANGRFDVSIEEAAVRLRKVIVDQVAADKVTFTDAMLERSNEDYCTYISNKNTWGGAIELHILSKHFKVEIVAVDIQNVRLNRFGETENYAKRILLIYDNTHYDPLKMESFDSGATHTLFSTKNADVLTQALDIAKEAKNSFQFYDGKGGHLRCATCSQTFLGDKDAKTHAEVTWPPHDQFAQIPPDS